MKRIREELIEVRNKLDELIKWLGIETEVASQTELTLENIIFNPKVFDSEKKLYALKQTIGNFISANPTKDEKKMCRKYERSLSYEKQKWEKNGMLLKVMDCKGLIAKNGMQNNKAVRLERLAREIFTVLNLLIKDMRNLKH